MDASFWHKCWERNSLGFHQEEIHPFLIKTMSELIQPNDRHVFVPLCGKSLDMVWLAEHLEVTGAELSEIACRDFFKDKSIEFQQHRSGDFQRYSFENLTLWQGDFFTLANEKLPSFDWVYDRAALIALPVEMQQQYVDHLLSFMADNTRLLLISLEFPVEEMSGPPFPIFIADIEKLFTNCKIECIATRELPDKRFAQRTFNVSSLVERGYLITK